MTANLGHGRGCSKWAISSKAGSSLLYMKLSTLKTCTMKGAFSMAASIVLHMRRMVSLSSCKEDEFVEFKFGGWF